MKAVLDTVVLISSVLSTGTPHNVVVAGFQIVATIATLTEFREALLKYLDRFDMDEGDVQKEVETIRYFADFVEPEEHIFCPHELWHRAIGTRCETCSSHIRQILVMLVKGVG